MPTPEQVLLRTRRQLVDRHAPRIGRSDAEDLASEALTRALEHPAPDGRHAPWLEVIFRRLLCDHFRRRARARRGAASLALPAAVTGCEQTPEAALLAAERRCLLDQALAAVPAEQRAALAARFWPDDHAAGAVTPVTLRTRVHRALARLREPRGLLARLRALIPLGTAAPATHVLGPALVVALAASASGPLALPARAPLQLAQATVPPTAAAARARPPAVRDEVLRPAPPAPPVAAPSPPPTRAAQPRAHTPAGPRPAATTRFDFEDDDVIGDLQVPGDDLVMGPPGRAPRPSLIEIPSSFLPAIARMLEEL
jgi:DNA-directed RNA polymerase specialized sigma24 family protein